MAAKPRICRWCGKPTKKGYDKNGRFKDYHRTCGDEKCLYRSRHEQNPKKRYEKERICKICNNKFIAYACKQIACSDCLPTKRDTTLFRRYGITPEQYDDMVKKVNGVCPICKKDEAFVVDHDHKTGRVRGVICYKCNYGLHFFEDRELMQSMIKYLYKED